MVVESAESVVVSGVPDFAKFKASIFDMKVDEKGVYYQSRVQSHVILCYSAPRKQWLVQSLPDRGKNIAYALITLAEYAPVTSIYIKVWQCCNAELKWLNAAEMVVDRA